MLSFKSIILWCLFFCCLDAFGQGGFSGSSDNSETRSKFDRNVRPPSPEAAQLGVFGNLTPDLNSGAVQVSIPLRTVSSRQLSLPLSLDYHYTGLVVDEIPSWAGLGWTIRAGGVITRTVRGLPDEVLNGVFIGYTQGSWRQLAGLLRHRKASGQEEEIVNHRVPPQSGTDQDLNAVCYQLNRGEIDTEPDAYSISTPFYSGQLIVDSLGNFTCSPRSDLTIRRFSFGWSITTGDGTRYDYNDPEITTYSDDVVHAATRVQTAWYLSEIHSADGTDSIRLGYLTTVAAAPVPVNTMVKEVYAKPGLNIECNPRDPAAYKQDADVRAGSWPNALVTLSTLSLTSISTATTDVSFISDTQRLDIDILTDRPARKLTGIVYRDLRSNAVKSQYAMTYGYCNGSSPTIMARRLRLDAVQEIGKPAHRFQYIDGTLPPRGSFAKDHWGYYNGQTGNTSLIPRVPPYLTQVYGLGQVHGAIRTPDGNFGRRGALSRVQYPTGGWTTFEYEPNEGSAACALPDETEQFGETAASLSCTTYRASVHGATPFNGVVQPYQMDSLSQAFVSNYSNGGGDGNISSGRQRAAATLINAPYGFYLCDVRVTGIISEPQATACSYAQQYVNTYLYSSINDSISGGMLSLVCGGSYTPGPNCTTVVKTDCGKAGRVEYPAGRYYLVAEINDSSTPGMEATIEADVFFKPRPVTAPNQAACVSTTQIGGIRVMKTQEFAGQGDTTTRTYRYREPNGTGWISSGRLFVRPKYAYFTQCRALVVGAADVSKANWLDQGYHVGYTRVEVETENQGGGKTVYHYDNRATNGNNLRNLLLKKEEFNQEGGLVKETENTYTVALLGASPGLRLSQDYLQFAVYLGQPAVGEEHYWLVPTSYEAWWPQLTRTTERLFGTGAGAGASEVTTRYTYLAPAPSLTTQPVSEARTLSNGRQTITKTRYYGQYDLNVPGIGAPAQGLGELAQKKMIGVPVERQTWVRTATDSAVVGGELTHFKSLRPARVFSLATATPIPSADFLPSRVQAGTFQQDARYIERAAFPAYSPLGNLRQEYVTGAPPTSYLWGHDETAVLAEAKNATYNRIAYTSFEPDATGRWQYDSAGTTHYGPAHFTGRRGYQLDGTSAAAVSRPHLPAGDYELLVWGYGLAVPLVTGSSQQRHALLTPAAATGWQLHRFQLRVPADGTITLNATQNQPIWIDELRLSPVGAKMTSYTHDPLVGMTSQTDPSGRTITYEYDGLGRLVCTRDEKGRILSRQQYHYAGQ